MIQQRAGTLVPAYFLNRHKMEVFKINKFLYEILISPLDLPVNPIIEYLILGIIGIVAFKIAWKTSPGGIWGSVIHYSVRFITFTAMWAITRIVIIAVKWITENIVLVSIIFSCLVLAIIILCFVMSLIYKKTYKA